MIRKLWLHSTVLFLIGTGSLLAEGTAGNPEKAPVQQEGSVVQVEPPMQPAGALFQPRSPSRSFAGDLGRNLIGLFSRENLVPLLIGAGAAGIGRTLDRPVNRWFGHVEEGLGRQEESRLRGMEDVGGVIGTHWFLAAGLGGMFLADRFTESGHFQSFTYASAQGFLLNTIVTTGLKQAVRRNRPDESNRRSFPSGHTSNMFTMATIANHYYGPKVGIPAFIGAGFVGLSRMDEGVHYLSDVLAGATLGYIVGRTVVRGIDRNRRFHYFPILSSKERTVGVSVTAVF